RIDDGRGRIGGRGGRLSALQAKALDHAARAAGDRIGRIVGAAVVRAESGSAAAANGPEKRRLTGDLAQRGECAALHVELVDLRAAATLETTDRIVRLAGLGEARATGRAGGAAI